MDKGVRGLQNWTIFMDVKCVSSQMFIRGNFCSGNCPSGNCPLGKSPSGKCPSENCSRTPPTLIKRDFNKMFSYETFEIFKNTFFYRTSLVAISEHCHHWYQILVNFEKCFKKSSLLYYLAVLLI